ncbi:hypothetical protein ACWPKO_21200 (plasmid) [Coraliomargarita sp. W4R53]
MASPFLYYPDERLSLAELSAACLDGDLVELGHAYIPADAVETAALRAGSLASLLGTALAASHLSAAWVHGALYAPPERHTVQRAVPQRRTRLPARFLVYRDVALPPEELERIGGVWVTSPVRTVSDLLRTADDAYRAAAALMIAAEARLLTAAILHLEACTLPYKRDALKYLRAQYALEAP